MRADVTDEDSVRALFEAVIRRFGGRVPVLGVCLGHQCIGYVYGASVVHAPVPTHGKASKVYHDGGTVYSGLPNPFEGGRYHSLVVGWGKRPAAIEATAVTAEGVIMGVRHRKYSVEGVQFHPESIMTDVGHNVLRNFLRFNGGEWENGVGKQTLQRRDVTK